MGGVTLTTEIQDELVRWEIDPLLGQEILAMVKQKPPYVRKAFLLRMRGETQAHIACVIGTCQQNVSRWISRDCADIRRKLVEKCPESA